jgi:F5/8 type C domain
MVRLRSKMRRRPVPLTVLLLGTFAAFVLVACGGSSTDDLADVAPLSDILDGEVQVVDITATSAGIRIGTSVPVVCSVIYGTDDSYGSQSTDLDMAGVAHVDHAAPMRGLEPDTVYHYRLQGTGSDGTIYVSEDMTFRTPPADDSSVGDKGDNLASLDAGASIVEASSFFGNSATWRPENAIDGDGLTEWSSQGDGNDAFLTIRLAGEARITEIGVWTRTMGTSAQIESFKVVTDRGETLGPFTLVDATGLFSFPVDVTATTLRFEIVSSSGGNTGLIEVAAYGTLGEQ